MLTLPSGKQIIDHHDDGLSIVWKEGDRNCMAKLDGTALELFYLLQNKLKNDSKFDRDFSQALNEGDGIYRP